VICEGEDEAAERLRDVLEDARVAAADGIGDRAAEERPGDGGDRLLADGPACLG
jgi:hypothetical protein